MTKNAPYTLLTKQELSVLKLIPERHLNKEIAAALFISVEMTKTHLKNIYKKLIVNNKVCALLKSEALKNTPNGGLSGI